FYDTVTYGGAYSYDNVRTVADTGASGWNVWAYTAQFGGGFSATISAEDPQRGRNILDASQASIAYPLVVTNDNLGAALNGFHVPDIIGNLRLDQPWGYISASVALHQVAAAYYGTGNVVSAGYPSDKWGYGFSIGGVFNIPTGATVSKLGINFQY